ncbi:MAG: tRNA (adenosine(37)-N6)-dimethylallyltransferase MiaA [Gemmataceae bacterium]|nr:tRNA (adenosine(37)-N6)-dimethylallyltransferase MiaA [Gemmataceae bacterium]
MEFLRHSFVLTGPTASGKTVLALEMADKLHAEIICMDSMTLYRQMDIGTAKPTPEQRMLIPHHLLDVLNPDQSSNVAWWLEEAAAAANSLLGRGKTPLFVGGTPLYLKALLFGLFPLDGINQEQTRLIENEFENCPSQELHLRLSERDPQSASKIHPNDRKRVVRALVVHKVTGRPISEHQRQWNDNNSRPQLLGKGRCIWLQVPRQELYRRIHERTAQALKNGWVDEAKSLLNNFHAWSREATEAIGYKEIFDFLTRGGDLRQVEEQINLRTRHFAKHQETWFRHLPNCQGVSEESKPDLWIEFL